MATEQQIPKLAGSLVEHQGAFAALSNDDAQWVITNTKSAIGLFVDAVIKNRAKQVRQKLLEFVTTLHVKSAKKFVARDNFKVDTSDKAEVKISFLNDVFKKKFLGKVEEDVPEADLKVHKLLRGSLDPNIIVELGENHETQLSHVRSAIALQPKGEEGNLLTNGWANIFYVRDAEGILSAVFVRWDGDGWYVDASSVEDPDGWLADHRVLSR